MIEIARTTDDGLSCPETFVDVAIAASILTDCNVVLHWQPYNRRQPPLLESPYIVAFENVTSSSRCLAFLKKHRRHLRWYGIQSSYQSAAELRDVTHWAELPLADKPLAAHVFHAQMYYYVGLVFEALERGGESFRYGRKIGVRIKIPDPIKSILIECYDERARNLLDLLDGETGERR